MLRTKNAKTKHTVGFFPPLGNLVVLGSASSAQRKSSLPKLGQPGYDGAGNGSLSSDAEKTSAHDRSHHMIEVTT
jgi:hypothetical protein